MPDERYSFEPKSSHIRRVEYDAAKKELFVRFSNGSLYRYDNVPHEAFDNFERFRSAGEFHATVIKRYKTTQVEGARK